MHAAMASYLDGISTSSISVTPATTGCHMLKIDGYSKAKQFGGFYTKSPTFAAAGQAWSISFYPNVRGGSYDQQPSSSDGHISLFINPCSLFTGNTRAMIRFSLVPHVGEPEPPPYGKSFAFAFGDHALPRDTCGFPCFIRREELEKSGYLVDDCFAIRCDVEVVKMSAAAGPAAVDAHDLERLALPCTCDDDRCKRFHVANTGDGHGHDGESSPARAADRACTCKDGLCKQCAMKAPPPQRQRRGRAMAAWFRLFKGSGKSETETADHQTTCKSLKKPLLSSETN